MVRCLIFPFGDAGSPSDGCRPSSAQRSLCRGDCAWTERPNHFQQETSAPASGPPPAVDLDTAQFDQIIGVKGQNNGGVYQFGVPRRDPITESGMALTPVGPLGAATGIGFQPTGGGKAAITGDFVLSADEVNPVIKALCANGIEITALHSHMLDEQPRLFFMHFWANDDAIKLAKGLRAALDKMANAKS